MPSTPPYAELHCHSAYSLLDGASLPEELAYRAADLRYGALALTDHDSLAGAMELAIAARACSLHAIFGAELTVQAPAAGEGTGREGKRAIPRRGPVAGRRRATGKGSAGGRAHAGPHHLTLLVRDGRGWSNLCRLITHAHAHTREGAARRVSRACVSLERVLEHAEGLVCLTGCARQGMHDERAVRSLREAFGAERLRVELQRPYLYGDRARNRALERLAERLGVRTVATGDIHAHTHARALLQDALVAIRHGMTLDESELERRGNHSHVLASPHAMAARFADHPDAVAESLRLAESLEFELMSDLGYRYPGYEDERAHRTLSEVCERAFALRYPQGHARRSEAAARLREELSIIGSLELSGFFLLHHDVLELAREVAAEVRGAGEGGVGGGSQPRALLPPGRGRGSSVSSLVCYLTGLSHIDPIEAELAIGRFLHEDITSLPDIDVDFPRDVRERLIPRVIERYGPERAALVAAYSTYKPRGAIRELGKALGLPAGEIERVARGSEGHGTAGTVAQDIRVALGPERVRSGRWAWLARLADEVCGLPRHLSQHPGGMVIATRPLIDCCPVVPAAMEGRQVIQWDKDSAADAGFLKLDLLSLGMLSAVERCVELIAKRRGEAIDLSRIPFDDPATFQLIQEADTTGVFQIESRAQMASLRRTRPGCLKDLTIQVALVRPGPIVGGAVNPYIERRQRLHEDPGFEVPYLHDSLREPLAETLGTIIFQDQVIEVARAFAGFSTGDAEGLRRAMSRKRSEEAVERHHRGFVDGALRTHADVDRELAERVWAMVRGFAGFGFPKAHGAAFGLLAYQSTYLRAHYPGELLCALLNEQPMGFYSPDSLVHDAQRHGIAVRPPDVNRSEAECTLTGQGAIQLGLSYVKGLRKADIERLLRARSEVGRFSDFEELAARSGLSRSTLERLAWAGACEGLAGRGAASSARRTALWQLGVAGGREPADAQDQLALGLPLADAPRLRAPSEWEQMIADYASSSVSVERHPVELLRDALEAQGAVSITELAQVPHGGTVSVGGLVIARQRPATARGIVFLLLEDEQGTLNVIVSRSLYERRRAVVRTQPLVLAQGRLERHPAGGGQINLLASELLALRPSMGPAASVTSLPTRAGEAHVAGGTAETSHAATGTEDFSAVAPPVISFARGRGR
jgi:error-prone DNA polymerase